MKRPRIAPETKPRPGAFKASIPEHPKLPIRDDSDQNGPEDKKKSDPGKAAPCKYWSG